MARASDKQIEAWREFAGEQSEVHRILDELDAERANADEWHAAVMQSLVDEEHANERTAKIVFDYKLAVSSYEVAIAQIRRLHQQYLPFAVDYDCCSHCNLGNNNVPWPCDTIRILDERKPQR